MGAGVPRAGDNLFFFLPTSLFLFSFLLPRIEIRSISLEELNSRITGHGLPDICVCASPRRKS